MIAVAFALHETFGTADGTERSAFERVARGFAENCGTLVDSKLVDRIAGIQDAAFSTPAALAQAFSTALRPTLLPTPAQLIALESQFRMAAADAVHERFVPFPDTGPALRRVAEMNVPRVALSAGWPPIDQRKADIAGFDGPIVFAQDLGLTALMPAAFARVAQSLKLPAERIWFVGSDPEAEILPASASGFRTIWLNRDGAAFPAARPAPDATISSLDELFDVLREPYTRGLLALRYILRTALDWRPGHFIPGTDSTTAGETNRD